MNVNQYAQKYQLKPEIFISLYNINDKMQFVQEQCGHQELKSQVSMIREMSHIGKIEHKLNKDVSTFTSMEMQMLFKDLNTAVKSTFQYRKSVIKKYLVWSFAKGNTNLQNIVDLDNISIDQLDLSTIISSKYFRDFTDLKNGIDVLVKKHNPVDPEYDAVSCIAMYLAWFGLSDKQICSLQRNEIDYCHGIINKDNRQFHVNDYVLNQIHDSLSKTEYDTMSDFSNHHRFFQYDTTTNNVIRRLQDNKVKQYNVFTLHSHVSTLLKYSDYFTQDDKYFQHTFGLKDIRDSGFFNRLYCYQKNHKISVKTIDKSVIYHLLYVSRLSCTKLSNLLSEYAIWKEVFCNG